MKEAVDQGELLTACVGLFHVIQAVGHIGEDDIDDPVINAEANDIADDLCTRLEALVVRQGISAEEFTDAIFQGCESVGT